MVRHQKKVNLFFGNIVVKSVILTVLPLFYSIAIPYALDKGTADAGFGTLITVSAVVLILHVIALIQYGRIETRQKKEIARQEMQVTGDDEARKLLDMVEDTVHNVALSIHELIMQKKDHSEVKDWKYLKLNGDAICLRAYEIVRSLAEKGDEFSVSLMFRQRKNGKTGYTMLSRKSSDPSHKPRSYRNFVEESEATGYCYKKIFDEAPTRPVILPDKKAIEQEFEDYNAVPYAQYIGLPIICKENRVVGVLQIVAYNKSVIARGEENLQKLCDNYFCVLATLMLLADKYENIQQCI